MTLTPLDESPIVVILTALQVEIQAVTAHLSNLREAVDEHGIVYDCGDFCHDNGSWKVAVAECGQGNNEAGSRVHFAHHFFWPDLVLFVGVAGSLKERDATLGDVVASTQIYHYQSGKATAQFQPRPRLEFPALGLLERAKATARRANWIKRSKCHWNAPNRKAKAIVAPIASGDQVVVDVASFSYEVISQYYGDAVAVEMEGYGALRAAKDLGVPALVVRGISDHVKDKNARDEEGWQLIAAQNASAFTFEMLTRIDPGTNHRRQASNFPPKGDDGTQGATTRRGDPNSTDDRSIDSTVSNLHGQYKLSQIESAFGKASQSLLNWDRSLLGGTWIHRPELPQLIRTLDARSNSSTLLLGSPGSGKSAILASVAIDCIQQNLAVLGIKADAISPSVDSAKALAQSLVLPGTVGACVKSVAATKKVVVLIDQLDALANLVDLHSDRLNILLNLVKELSDTPNVHIICSCREFEYQHDARLTAIDAEVVTLELPEWDLIQPILLEQGINAENWPDSTQQLMRSPQHLKIFIERIKGSTDAYVYTSYQEILEHLWDREVAKKPNATERRTLCFELASQMAEKETLWLASARFEQHRKLIDELVASGILAWGRNGRQIGFQHQSLFDFVRALLFTTGHGSLSDYIIAREESLFVRPTLWSTLAYLRSADPQVYYHELDRICAESTRLHIRFLVIDFLAQIDQPDNWEVRRLVEFLRDATYCRKVLAAIRGRRAWFQSLHGQHLPPVMRLSADQAFLASQVISAAWNFAPQECAELIERYWLPFKEFDNASWNALEHCETWDERLVNFVSVIVKRNDVDPMYVMQVALSISEDKPALASKFISVALARAMEQSSGKHKVSLDSQNDWFDLNKIAKAAPQQFLDECWPLFVSLVRDASHSYATRTNEYVGTHTLSDLDDEDRYPIFIAFLEGVIDFAKMAPREFLAFAKKWGDFDGMLPQRILARGVIETAKQYSAECLEYLLSDPRRFALGTYHHRLKESQALILAICPYLNPTQIARLEEAIFSWKHYEIDPGSDSCIRDYNRDDRRKLLAVIPFDRLTPKSRDMLPLNSEERAKLTEPEIPDTEMERIESPLPAIQMEEMSNAELLGYFGSLIPTDENRDQIAEFHETMREFVQFAERFPERVSEILEGLQGNSRNDVAAHGIEGLGKSALPSDKLFDLIQKLDERGFESIDFRVQCAQALKLRLKDGVGLPDKISIVLEKWLAEPWDQMEGDNWERETTTDKPRPILWGMNGMVTLPHGSYFVLYVLTYALLLRKPPATERWLSILEAHLRRNDTARTWHAFASELRWVVKCDRARAANFVWSLF